MSFVNKTYIINLPYRIDRMMSMIDLMKELKINNWVRFDAIRPRFKDIDKDMYSGFGRIQKLSKKYVKGAIGCKQSHIAILEEARSKGYRRIMILEDDLEIIGKGNNMRNIIDTALKELENKNWDILYLGLNKEKTNDKDELMFVDRVEKGLCTHAYIVNGKAYYKILKILKESNKQIDIVYQECFEDSLKCYILRPKQFRQNKSYSDINKIFL